MFNTRKDIRSGSSFARGTTIDEYLNEDDCITLYEKWSANWEEPFVFSGNIKAITCEMVLTVDKKELTKVYGKKLAETLIQVSERNAAR